MVEHTRIAVVGGGVMGLSAAWALTRRGERPLVLERFGRGHSRGASHGETRNFNNAYAEEHYLDLLALAREGWDALGEVDGEPLLRLHGLVSHGAGAALGSAAGVGLADVERRLHERGLPAELLDGAEAARRWPGMRFEDTVLYSPDAGVARAAAALREVERRIAEGGGEVRWQTPVDRIEEDADGVTLHTAGGPVRADTVIVTVGAWTAGLLASIPLPRLRVTEESPAHFAPRDPATPWPSFNHFVTPGTWPANVYGMPTPGEGVKVGFHCVGDEVDPDARPFRTDAHAETLAAYVREWFPGLDAATAAPISCTYTSTADEAFVLDRVGRVVVGAGFSGQGFKFAPGVGSTLAGLALDPAALAAPAFRLRP
ncbi:FAD-dependent oxidoreductase [Microbacterium terricola]|uniref:N-methyl-L-tryptophan oxidase n=1 Tax=Microbacterium terricola TaxID=344163 RepID=A0ABM8DW06_9MICO|nr:FAD-dependent oxidoreductase [Microbacterium terricola]UYK39448.1 FAD-dependent oxidoreductase [Microbacterium terricola]BDV29824.1 N-methyl-L-tryptophan oxidase [Microbacterium terricola]